MKFVGMVQDDLYFEQMLEQVEGFRLPTCGLDGL
jgi:hypothetical protein